MFENSDNLFFRKISTALAFTIIILVGSIAAAISMRHLQGIGQDLEPPHIYQLKILEQPAKASSSEAGDKGADFLNEVID